MQIATYRRDGRRFVGLVSDDREHTKVPECVVGPFDNITLPGAAISWA